MDLKISGQRKERIDNFLGMFKLKKDGDIDCYGRLNAKTKSKLLQIQNQQRMKN